MAGRSPGQCEADEVTRPALAIRVALLTRSPVAPAGGTRVRHLGDGRCARAGSARSRSIGILREQEAGASRAEPCREHGIGDATFDEGKARCGGLELSGAERRRALEDENAKLKRRLAEAMPDNAALKDPLRTDRPRPRRAGKWCGG